MNNISNETLLEDIENTEKELDAYYNISHGFKALSNIKENSGNNDYCESMYKKYLLLHDACAIFLQHLLEIKKNRNL